MFVIARAKKLKGMAGLKAALEHNTRERETPNADPTRTHLNFAYFGQSAAQGLAMANRLYATVDRKIQANAVRAVEYVITASPDFFKKPNSLEFLAAAHNFLETKHGKHTVISAVVHMDESTPHLHFIAVPVLQKEKRYTHKLTKETTVKTVTALDGQAFIGGRGSLIRFQDEMGELGKGFGLQRGLRRSKATHVEISTWYSKARLAAGGGQEASRPEKDPFAHWGKVHADVLAGLAKEAVDCHHDQETTFDVDGMRESWKTASTAERISLVAGAMAALYGEKAGPEAAESIRAQVEAMAAIMEPSVPVSERPSQGRERDRGR